MRKGDEKVIDTSQLKFPKPAHKLKATTRYRTCRQTMQEKAIALSAKIVTFGGKCFRCGKDHGPIDSHHIAKRSYKKTAALLTAQIPLCRYTCHIWAEDNPEEFQKWVDTVLPGRRAELDAINSTPGKPDWESIYLKLYEQYHAMLPGKK